MRCRFFADFIGAIFLVVVCVGFLQPSFAVMIPLSGLTGGYELDPWVAPDFDYPGVKSVDFVIPDNIAAIDQLTFVISGEWHVGEISCNTGFEFPEISPVLPPLTLLISSDEFPGDFFMATIQMPDTPFEDLTAEFSSCCPPGVLELDNLLGADLHAELFIDMAILGICYLTIDTYGTLNQVQLHLTGTVPTVTTHWSSVKALFR